MLRLIRLTFLALILLGCPPTWALSGAWQGDDDAKIRLISATNGTGHSDTLTLGLDIELGENWHTYWRSPGMAGLPPQFDWTRSQNETGNLKSTTILYPAPKRYTAYNLETVGYRGHVILPLVVTLREAGKPLTLDTDLSLLVCSSICVPKNVTLSLTIPAGEATPSAEAELIEHYRSQVPGDGDKAGFLIQSITNDGQAFMVTITTPQALPDPDIFVETKDQIAFKPPIISRDEAKHSLTLRVEPVDTLLPEHPLAGLKTTLTIVAGDNALERQVTLPGIGATPPSLIPPAIPLGLALGLALIGGFILNLMPCVLPVLSLKVLSVISHGGGTPAAVRRSFCMTACGIITSFLILGGATTALRSAGYSFGWGVQFQQPGFLIFLILLLTLFTASLWELITINLPQIFADRVNSAAYHPKLAGDFATGAFATLLATPCSAPFLGTAVGFALMSDTTTILMVFTALGCGMALPYFLIASFPRLATALPKPGAWMIRLRQILGGALALTAIWLLWVLAAQITPLYAALVGLALTIAILLLALIKQQGHKRKAAGGAIVLLIGATIYLVASGALIPKREAQVDQLWQSFSPNRLAADLAEGKTVFLDITADWCITCKANKKFVLSSPTLTARLFHSDIVAMQADWTNPDPVIADFLHKYGRYGIPFNAAFGPGAPQGILLPELLTEALVNDAIDKASKSGQ